MYAGMFARQNAQSSNPKVRMLAAEKQVTSAEVALQRAERDLERAVENAKRVKLEPSEQVRSPIFAALTLLLMVDERIAMANAYQCCALGSNMCARTCNSLA